MCWCFFADWRVTGTRLLVLDSVFLSVQIIILFIMNFKINGKSFHSKNNSEQSSVCTSDCYVMEIENDIL